MRHRAILAYDGTAYHGFQRQANAAPTIQGVVEEALAVISGQRISIVAAGRTDAGVHATGQVIAFNLGWRHGPDDLRAALNANLPQDVAALSVEQARADFHPRFDALSRSYVYRLFVAPVRDPLQCLRAWHLTANLDLRAIQLAVEALLGTHDFSTFGVPPVGDNPVRTVYEARWESDPEGQHSFTITANAFLYRMVRSLVGALVEVGQRRMAVGAFRGMLAACDRSLARTLAPPQGLTLVAVHYPE